jgi:hypothetical protein
MSFFLYFASFGSVLVLFGSIIAGCLWLTIGFFRAWGRFFQVLLEPPERNAVRRRPRIDPSPHLLKRAGQ